MGEERIKENLNIILNRFHKHDEGWQAKVLEEITAANVALFRSQNNDDDATDRIFDVTWNCWIHMGRFPTTSWNFQL